MPWSNQSGGGGPWKGGGNNGGPWGSGGGGGGNGNGPWGGGSNRGGGNPPDLEELLKRTQDRMRNVLPGGGGGGLGFIGGGIVVGVALIVWLAFGFYVVDEGEVGVELVLGKVEDQTPPGLNYNWPYPIGEVYTPKVELQRETTVGTEENVSSSGVVRARDVQEESLMLTGDENIVDVGFKVLWRIRNTNEGIADFLFNIRNPEATIKIAAESSMREVIGQTALEDATTGKRQQVQQRSRVLLQKILDDYGAGVAIAEVQLQKADPPAEVIDAFHDVQRARQDQERAINEAKAYQNDIVPRAKGKAQTIIQGAEAYKEKVVKEADGEAKRFLSVYETYKIAKDVTVRRLFLERMQEVFKNSEKVIIDKGQGGTGVVPYLPLPELRKRQRGESK